FSRWESDAAGAAIFHQDFRDRCLRADFDSGLARGGRDRIGDGAGATTAESPRAERAIDFAHVVMEKNIRGAWRTNAEECSDDAGSRHSGFEDVRFKPLVEEISGAH